MFVTFYLSAATSGSTVSSTFTITGEPGSYSEAGVSKEQLLAGKIIEYPESVTGGTVTATDGTCSGTSTTWAVNASTPTPTPTSSVPLGDPFFIYYGNAGTGAGSACVHANNTDAGYRVRVCSSLVDNDNELMTGHYYYNPNGTPFDGTIHSNWATVSNYGTIGSDGQFTYLGSCL